jgi:hypothetical protein
VDVTVVIPTIPPRADSLTRAVSSVTSQTRPAAALAVAVDTAGVGAPATRQRALEMVRTPWVAFLDDDDYLLPEHLQTLTDAAVRTGADYVFSWFYKQFPGQPPTDVDDTLGHFGRPFDPASPHQTTVTTLVRTEVAVEARCDQVPEGLVEGQRAGEDWLFTLACVALGARIVHVPVRTWVWVQHHAHTSGRPWQSFY